MGGDHKCPVCQATFTRPQHVARHMRSHTGDRPYKCQYCGDQFARSDLLARHINKCHANEKPLPSTTPGSRKKGSVATSRATTSKQACDQCVQSSLPCDGSNPCAKCLSRKYRCTYVKFHRQTAPSGPGHHLPQSSPASGVGTSRPSSHVDDFVLAPPPSAPAPTTGSALPGTDQIFTTPFTFNTAAPAYPPNWLAPDIALSQSPFLMPFDADMVAKYHAHTDLLRRAPPPILSDSPPTMLPNMYATHPPSSNWHPAWGESATYPSLEDTKPLDGMARTHAHVSSEPSSFTSELYGAGLIGSAYRPRRMSLDLSDSSSATSQSVPSSAASSNVHLPLSGNEMYDARSAEAQRNPHVLEHHHRASISTSQPPSFPAPLEPSQPQHTGEGGFSSAFVLMSIDDPNVLAGLASDGIPFFSNLGMGVLPHSPNSTPMPTRVQHAHPHHQGRDRGLSSSALPTPRLSKDAVDARELRDTWRTCVRSPLSVPDLSTWQPSSLAQMPQSPSGQRRRARVSSLPSVTPTIEKGHLLTMNGHGQAGTVRTAVHGNPDDLRSYEAAVNARSAPLKLNLVPKRRGARPSPPTEGAEIAGASLPAGADQVDHQGISRPSSSSSSSSLAQAFTVPTSQHPHPHHPSHAYAPVSGVVKPPPMHGASISLPSVSMSGPYASPHSHGYGHLVASASPDSRASSVTSDGTGTGGSGSDSEFSRPSCKRYPSQTLGPASSKRAMVERGRGELKRMNCNGEGGDGTRMDGFKRTAGVSAGVETCTGSPGSRPIAGLPERAKRG